MVRIVQKLRLFLFVVAILVGMPAHADTTAIQSVIAYGKTEQSGTPTPTNPVPIMTNNGVLKYRFGKNLFDGAWEAGIYNTTTGAKTNANNRIRSVNKIIVQPATTYTLSLANGTPVARWCFYDENQEFISSSSRPTATTPDNAHYATVYLAQDYTVETAPLCQIERGSTATAYVPYNGPNGIYADGMVETIRDAAGHTATAQMLLGINDTYRDEQNITTGAITRRVGVKVLDGSESWELYNWDAQNVRDVMRVTLSSIAPDAKNNLSTAEQLAVTKCTHLEQRGVSAFNGDVSGFAWATKWFDTTARVAIRVAGITTVAQFKQWLAEQYAAGTPVIIVYPLATETTESVAPQSLTTAPVRQTLGAIMNMPIKTILKDNTEIMSGTNELIKIATTKYNEESFEDVQGALTGVFNAVDTVVTQTMTQAQQIDQIANEKQTRPDETCPVGKNCLLVEDEQGIPHWYVIAGADEANPTNP